MSKLDKLLEAFWSGGNVTAGQGRRTYYGGKRVFIPAFEEQEHPRGQGGKFTGKSTSVRAEHVKDERVKDTPLRVDKPIQTTISIQKHVAERAGEHRDLRIKVGDKAASWALPKNMPDIPGKPRLAIQQPEHEASYMGFSGCFTYRTKILTEDGPKFIGEIVDSKYGGQVFAYNFDTNKVELKPIKNWFNNGTNREWISIHYSDGNSHGQTHSFVCTPNHEIYTLGGKKIASNIRLGDTILLKSTQLDPMQEAVLYGTMLGDGCIPNRNRSNTRCLLIQQSIKQKEYAEYKLNIFDNFRKDGIIKIQNSISPAIDTKLGFKIKERTKVVGRITHPVFNKIANKFYTFVDGKQIKGLPNDLYDKLTWASLAFWYMDDGSLHKRYYTKNKDRSKYCLSIRLHTQGFTKDGNILLADILNKKFGLDVSVSKCNGGSGSHLVMYHKSAITFLNNTAQYGIPSMQYKFDKIDVGNFFMGYTPEETIGLSEVEVLGLSLRRVIKSIKYDIEVADTHNYFVDSGILVSNSIPSGYGKGRVKVEHWGDIDILKWGKDEKKIQVLSGKKKGVYTLKRTDKNNWMIIKHKEGNKVTHYKLVPAKKKLKPAMWDDPNYVGELKRDGARYALEVGADGTKVISVRKSATGKVLDKSANVPQISHELKSKEYAGTVLDTEIFHDKGHSTLGGIMNSLPDKARETQKQIGNAKYEVFDILKYKGVDVTDKSYSERRTLIEKLHKEINLPITQKFETNKYEKYKELIAKGEEGVVLKNKNKNYYGSEWAKAKKDETVERAIIGFEKVADTAKAHGGKVGAIRVAAYENGKWVYAGKVTSGLSDELRDSMTKSPEKYLGKIIEIKGMGVYPGTAKMRQPTLTGLIKATAEDRYKYEINEKHPNNQKFIRERWDRISQDLKSGKSKSDKLFQSKKESTK